MSAVAYGCCSNVAAHRRTTAQPLHSARTVSDTHRVLSRMGEGKRGGRSVPPGTRYGEMWGDVGRYGEMWGDMARCGEIWPAESPGT